MKRAKHLFPILVSDENLNRAISEVNCTHHWKPHHKPNACTAWVEETREKRVEDLRRILMDGFVPKEPKVTRRWDTSARKWRMVAEPIQWPDQYVHHALIQVIQPVLMRGMDHYCCGSIRGRGPHHAMKAIKRWMVYDRKGTRYELCGDIRHFYESLRPEVVMDRMRRLIKDRQVLDLIYRVVENGIQIGAYTSQWFANTVLQPLDQMIRDSGLCKHYVRYMDNLTIFGPNRRKLHQLRRLIEAWLQDHDMTLKGDWQVFPIPKETDKSPLPPPRRGCDRPHGRLPDAVGYRYGRGYTLPRKKNLLNIKRMMARYRKQKQNGKRIPPKLAAGLISRLGQLVHCNNHNLYRMLFGGEKILRELKAIARRRQRKEEFSWSTYLERRETAKSSKSKDGSTPT